MNLKDGDFSDGLNALEDLIDDVIDATTDVQITTGVVEATTSGAIPTTAVDLDGLDDLVNSTTSEVEATSVVITTEQSTNGATQAPTDGGISVVPATTTAPMPKSTAASESTDVNQPTTQQVVNKPTTAPFVNTPTTSGIVVSATTSDDVTTGTDTQVTTVTVDVATTSSTSKSVTISGSLTTAYGWDDDLSDSTSALFQQYAATLESELAIIIKQSSYVYRFRVKFSFPVKLPVKVTSSSEFSDLFFTPAKVQL